MPPLRASVRFGPNPPPVELDSGVRLSSSKDFKKLCVTVATKHKLGGALHRSREECLKKLSDADPKCLSWDDGSEAAQKRFSYYLDLVGVQAQTHNSPVATAGKRRAQASPSDCNITEGDAPEAGGTVRRLSLTGGLDDSTLMDVDRAPRLRQEFSILIADLNLDFCSLSQFNLGSIFADALVD